MINASECEIMIFRFFSILVLIFSFFVITMPTYAESIPPKINNHYIDEICTDFSAPQKLLKSKHKNKCKEGSHIYSHAAPSRHTPISTIDPGTYSLVNYPSTRNRKLYWPINAAPAYTYSIRYPASRPRDLRFQGNEGVTHTNNKCGRKKLKFWREKCQHE